METILITGGTGMIGTALSKLLIAKGYKVILLSRSANVNKPSKNNSGGSLAHWNPVEQEVDRSAIEQADYIINLAGAGVADKRWTKKRKKEISDSRVQSGNMIVKALTEIPNKVKLVVNASAIGWYGEDPVIPNPAPFTEEMPSDTGFLGYTCKLWEQSIRPVTQLGKRLVIFRTAIVLSNAGGAFREFCNPLRFGIATVLGSGKQIVSWIHIDDLCKMYLYAIQEEKLQGVYNAAAPNPISNKELILEIARKKNKNFFISIPVPSFVLKMMLGEMSIEVLKSTTVSTQKIEHTGFKFNYPFIGSAVDNLIKR